MSSISLLQFLKNTNMLGTSVIAGWGGVGRKIDSIAVIETPIALQWLKGGELVLTTGYFLSDHTDYFLDFVMELSNRGASALGISPKSHIGTIPDAMVDLANQIIFPVISLPSNITFWQLSKFFLETISHAENNKTTLSNNPNIVEEDYGPFDLVNYLASRLNGVILLQNTNLEPIMIFYEGEKDISKLLLERSKQRLKEEVTKNLKYHHECYYKWGSKDKAWTEKILPIFKEEKVAAFLSFILPAGPVNMLDDKDVKGLIDYVMLSYRGIEKAVEAIKNKKRYVFLEALTKDSPFNFMEYTRIEPAFKRPGRIVCLNLLNVGQKSEVLKMVPPVRSFRIMPSWTRHTSSRRRCFLWPGV